MSHADVNGLSLHYEEHGSGEPLILLHGGIGAGEMFDPILPELIAGRRVITVDLRNHGRSERIRSSFSIEDLADQTAGVLDAQGVPHATVVGYSMGGMAAQALARRHPGKVDRLVLAATAARPIRHPRWASTSLFWLGRALARIDPSLAPRIAYRYLLATGAVPPEHGSWLMANPAS